MSPAEEQALFFQYLRFPSISALPQHAADLRACAAWLVERLSAWGLTAELRETAGPPAVMARAAHRPGRPTVLLYGHYDVQPVEPLDLWTHPPFEPVEREGFIFARGATDNKGQTFSHLLGLKRLLDAGDVPVNVKILLEGEEEIGSPHLEEFLDSAREDLACDCVLVSDTSMIAPGQPALTLGLRGIACFEVTVSGPARDLHSGMFGGAAPNPALALVHVLGKLHDEAGAIAIPHFYDAVREIPSLEKESWRALAWDESWFEKITGIAPVGGERGRSVLERVWGRPTAEINGLASGHQGAGSKTIVPSQASAKLSFRLVPDQHPEDVARLVIPWMESEFAKWGVIGRVQYDHGGHPFHTPPDHRYIQAAAAALKSVFGRAPVFTREGLSIPVVSLLAGKLHVPVILAGLGLPDCQAHAPNESFPAEHLELGAQVHAALLRALAGAS